MLLAPFASAQTVVEQAAEHRFQLDFRVNDAAQAKLLPPGWEMVIATQGPAKDCNLRMIFIDRMATIGGDGKAAARHTARLTYLAIPVTETGTKIAALFDGTEKVVSWDSFPWYIRTVSAP